MFLSTKQPTFEVQTDSKPKSNILMNIRVVEPLAIYEININFKLSNISICNISHNSV
jgi:hypothetical protein